MAATTLRGLLDAFVSNRMRRTAAEAERVPARLSVRKPPDGAADNERCEVSPTAGQHPLDHGFITDENPALVITCNEQGAWVVRDAKGQFRGAFLLKQSAVSFVGRHTQPAQYTMHLRRASNATSETKAIHLSLLATNKTIRKASS